VRSTADFFQDGARDDVQYYRSLYNIEQVEILRGPNAILFGRGGTGGALNRVTKKTETWSRFKESKYWSRHFWSF
jgi:catecholate siderophore receptor